MLSPFGRCILLCRRGVSGGATLLLRYGDGEAVGEGFRGAGEIRWLIFRPLAPAGNPYWEDGRAAADELLRAALVRFAGWNVEHVYAGGALPVPGVHGIPGAVAACRCPLRGRRFRPGRKRPDRLSRDGRRSPWAMNPPLAGLETRRCVGINGARLEARLSGELIGYIELDLLGSRERQPRHGDVADIGNLHVDESHQRQGMGLGNFV